MNAFNSSSTVGFSILQSVTYLARFTVPGIATAPPAKVESMYDRENFALSASRVFTT